MDIHLAIGQNHRFELHDALLIYKGGRESFITHHSILPQEGGPPSLGPAQPLTRSFVDSLLRSLGRDTEAEVLPENVLAKGDESLVWWTPRRERQMFYASSSGACAHLNGKTCPQPALVWKVRCGALTVRALRHNTRPRAETQLCVAPFWNLSHDGLVCLGSMRHPDAASVTTMKAWEDGFYESAFTHANVARITKHAGGFEALWSGLADKRKAFPSNSLIRMPQTLAEFIR